MKFSFLMFFFLFFTSWIIWSGTCSFTIFSAQFIPRSDFLINLAARPVDRREKKSSRSQCLAKLQERDAIDSTSCGRRVSSRLSTGIWSHCEKHDVPPTPCYEQPWKSTWISHIRLGRQVNFKDKLFEKSHFSFIVAPTTFFIE